MVQVFIDPKDVIEAFIRSPGPGGQNVNKVATCVVLWHKPTRIKIKCHQHRSQALNRQEAWELLAKAIADQNRLKLQAKKHMQEKERRRKRKRTLSSKEKMLKNKKHHASIKINRQKTVDWD